MPDVTLNKQQLVAVSMGTGTVQNMDVLCDNHDSLTVQADLNGAANGDLTVTVTPYEGDNQTLATVVIDPIASKGPTFVTSRVTFWGRYDVRGIERVRIAITNNNAGTQTLNRASVVLGPLEG